MAAATAAALFSTITPPDRRRAYPRLARGAVIFRNGTFTKRNIPMRPNATDYLTSNYFKGVALEPDVIIETKIVSVRDREFDDGPKVIVYTDYQGKGLVLNQTKLQTLISAYGLNYDNWIGKTILIKRGTTMYGADKVACVEIEAVVAERIGADKRPALEGSRRGSTDIRSGKGAWNDAPSPDDAPDGPKALDDDIPY
jgi:hypothetical protein